MSSNVPQPNKNKPSDSSATQASKFSSYVNNGRYVTILEGQINNIVQNSATPNSVTFTFVMIGNPISVSFTVTNSAVPTDTQTFSTLMSPNIIDRLQGNADYDVIAIAIYSSGNKYTTTIPKAFKTINEGPAINLRFSPVTNKTATLTFRNSFGSPTEIQLMLMDISNTIIQTITPVTSPYLITNLNINTGYKVQIRSIYRISGNSYLSAIASFSTLNEDNPIYLQTTNITNTGARILFSVIGSPEYNILTVTNTQDTNDTQTVQTQDTIANITNLGIGQTYNLSLLSKYTSNNSFITTISNAITTLLEDSPKALSITNTTGNTILFSFDPAVGTPLKYTAVFTNQTLTSRPAIIQDLSATITRNITIQNLEHTCNYLFTLDSVYSTGNRYTAAITLRTLNEGTVTNFQISSIQNTSIVISVTNTIGDSLYYVVNAKNINNISDQITVVAQVNNSVISLTGLTIHASYALSIQSIYYATNNRYIYSYVTPVTTLNEGPSIITRATNTTINSTSLTFSNIYGNPIYYQIDLSSGIYPLISTNYIPSIASIENTIPITGLVPNTNYKIFILTRYANQDTYVSNTAFLLNTKMIPEIVSYGVITDSSLALSFTTPIAPVDIYRIIQNGVTIDISSSIISQSSSSSNYFGTLTRGTSRFTISNLTANTAYDISFQFYYSDIQSSYTSLFQINTKGAVKTITLVSITDTVANITFIPPLVLPDASYNIFLTDTRNTLIQTRNIPLIDTSFSILNLSPNKQYSLKVTSNYNGGQFYSNTKTLITRDKPRNIQIGSIFDISAVLSFTSLLSTPDYYILSYNDRNSFQINPNSLSNFDLSFSYYIWSPLTPDASYNRITLASHYNDISYNFTSDIYPVFYTKSAVVNINAANITNTSAVIHFQNPIYTTPLYYIFQMVNNSNSSSFDVSFANTRSLYSLTGLIDNNSYTLAIRSVYDNIQLISAAYTFQTLGTPIITSFQNIYDTYLTIRTNTLLVPPTNYTLTFLDVESNIRLVNSAVSIPETYTLPTGFLTPNANYNVTIQAQYPLATYNTNNYALRMKGPPKILDTMTTDISATIFIDLPNVITNRYDYFLYDNLNNLLTFKQNALIQNINNSGNFFYVSNLTQRSPYSIAVQSYYSDISFAFLSSAFSFQTEGPPINLRANQVTNTQINISFDLPFNCFNFTVNATDISTNIITTYTTTNSPYTILDLNENTVYSIYVVANYANRGYSSNIIQTATISGLQINTLQNIYDTTIQAIINLPIQPPDSYAYQLQINNGITRTYPLTNYTIYDTSYVLLNIDGLVPNTSYTRFSITEYFSNFTNGNIIESKLTLTSNNVPFQTLGLSTISSFITDISATFSFIIPYVSPSSYSYRIGSDLNYYPIIPKTDGVNNFFTLSDLSSNTQYTSFFVYTYYASSDFSYNSLNLPFITKEIPSILTMNITDTSITVSFRPILTPTVSNYSYTIQSINSKDKSIVTNTINFIPYANNGNSTFNLSNLIPNTYFPIFKINVFYSDTQETYSSINHPFSTLGPVLNPMVSITSIASPSTTLSFYPPYTKPGYYIITNSNDVSLIVYDTSMIYFGNKYYYPIVLSTNTNISVVPYFATSGSIFSNTNVQLNSNLVINTGLVDLITNQMGNYIAACENTNIYISSDYGNTWTTNTFNTNISNITMDASGQNHYALYSGNPSFVYVSNNYGISWTRKSFLQGNKLSSIATDSSGQNVFIGGFGGAYNYFSNDFGNTWILDTIIDHNENSIGSIMNDFYIYTINSINNQIIQISKTMSSLTLSPSVYNALTISSFVPQYICSNRENTRLIVLGNSGIYVSNDGISWTKTVSTNYTWLSLNCDINCIRAIAVANGIGILQSEDGGLSWNIILPVTTNLKRATISGDGKYVYAYDNAKNFYSYIIPNTKGNVTQITASDKTKNQLILSAFPPTYLPDYAYDISAINTRDPYDIVSISSNKITNIVIPGLVADGSYQLIVTSNYKYPFQSFVSAPFSVYTRNNPSNFQIIGNPTDISATFQFQAPNAIPTKYILQDSSGLIVQNINITDLSGSGSESQYRYILQNLSPNQFYPNLALSSYYSDISTAYTGPDSISFYTRGPVLDISISSILDVSINLSFLPPKNTTDLSSNAYTIRVTNTVDPLETNTYYSNTNQNNNIYGLNADGSYNITINTNYINPIQALPSLTISTYTKSAPLGLRTMPDYITDTSAILQFQPPKIHPDYYILDVSSVKTNISLSSVFIQDGSYAVAYSDFLPNNRYLSNISLISYYSDTNSRLYANPISTFITKGAPVINTVTLDNANGATIVFTAPYVFPTTVQFQIYDNTTNLLVYNISQSNANDITLSGLAYNITYRIIPISIYSNKTIIGNAFMFYSRSPPIRFQLDPNNPITDIAIYTTFDAPFLRPDYYQWIITDISSNITTTFQINNTESSYSVSNLIANRYYSVIIQSVYNVNGSYLLLSTSTLFFYTKGPPINISIPPNTITNTAFTVNFQPPPVIPNQYDITVQNQQVPSDNQSIRNIGQNITILNLTTNSNYTVVLSSVYSTTFTASTSFSIATEGPPILSPIDTNTITDVSASVNFTRSVYSPNKYTYFLQTGNVIQNNVLPNTTNTSFQINNLLPNAYYSLYMNADYSNNIFSSNILTFYTKDVVQNAAISPNSITNISATLTFRNTKIIPPNPYIITINNSKTYTIPTNPQETYLYILPLVDLSQNTIYNTRIDSIFPNVTLSKNLTFITQCVPTDISISLITDISATITFQPCKNAPISYHMIYQNTNEINDIEIKNLGFEQTSNALVIWRGNIYISSDESTVFVYNNAANQYIQSLDKGNTWSDIRSFISGGTADTIYNFAVNETGYYLYSSTSGIYYSWNGGTTWIKSNAPNIAFRLLANTRSGNYAIAAADTYPVYYSVDYGKTWSNSNLVNARYTQLIMSANGSQNYILVGNTIIYKSSDYGKTWYAILDVTNNTYGILFIHKIYVSSNGNFLFIITDTVKNYISKDGGNTWTLNSTVISNILTSVFSFSIDGTYGFQLYMDGYMYYTTDSGVTWINSGFYTVTPINTDSLLKISDTGDYAILCTDISGVQKIYTNRSIAPNPVSFRFSAFIADSRYELTFQSNYSNAIYSSDTIYIDTCSAPYNITTTSDFTNSIVTFTPPFITFPYSYTVFLYEANYQLKNQQTILGNNSALQYSVTISDLSINTYYNIIVSSDYTGNISIYSKPTQIYTLFNPVIQNIYYSINTDNNTFTINVSYSTSNIPLYYLLKIEYPNSSDVNIYDTNDTTFYFFNLNNIGIYTITVTSVYPQYSLDTSTNIYVNTTIPVVFDSYLSDSNSITVNYTISDLTLPENYTLYLINSNVTYLRYSVVLPKTQTKNTFRFTGLITNSGTYDVYISYAGIYNTIKYAISLVNVQPNVVISDLSAVNFNTIVANYTIQTSFDTLYVFVLRNLELDISFNTRILSSSRTSRFNNLYYDSGTYEAFIRVILPSFQFNSTPRTVTLPYIAPVQIVSVTSTTNSIFVSYNLYNTYRSSYRLFIKSNSYADISFVLPVTNNSSNYTFYGIPYYNLGIYNVFIDVSFANGVYATPVQDISTVTVIPITIGTVVSNQNTITVPFTILPTYQSSYFLTLHNRNNIPALSYNTNNINSTSTSHSFRNLYYNSGTYDISMTTLYSGAPGKFTTDLNSITMPTIDLITFGSIITSTTSIYVPFTIYPSYQDTYTLSAVNTLLTDISYTVTSLSAYDTSYNFANLFYNSGSYLITMKVEYFGSSFTTNTTVTLSNITPIVIGDITTSNNTITIPYVIQPTYNASYIIYATHTSIPALSTFAPLIPTGLSSSYTFSNLFYNSGSYNISIDVSYNNNNSNYKTPIQTVNLNTITPITIDAISNTTNSIDVSYSFIPLYNPIYNIYIRNTTIPALSYSSVLSPTSSHYTLSNLFNNSGTYSINITASYSNGNNIFFTTDPSLSLITLPFVIPVTITNVDSIIVSSFNQINVYYTNLNLYSPVYTVNAIHTSISALNYSSVFSPASSSNIVSIPNIFFNSGTYNVSINVTYGGGSYTTDLRTITFSGSTIATINTVTTTFNSININYTILATYNSTYIIYAIPIDAPAIGTIQRVVPNNIYTNTITISGLIFDTGRYTIYMIVSYGSSQTFQSNSSTATLVFIPPITTGTPTKTFTSITVPFSLLPIFNARYTITATNALIPFSPYIYSYSFTDNRVTNYTFNNLPYNSGNYNISMSVQYNANASYTSTTLVASVANYGPIGTISSVVPGFNSLTIYYSVVPLIGASCSLNITNFAPISVSPTATSYTLTGMRYNSGTYSVVLSVSYVTGSTYNTPAVYATLPFYNFIQNGGFASGLNGWGYSGTVFTIPNNGGNNIPYINNGYANSLVLQWNGSNIYQNVYYQAGYYTLSFSYVAKNTNPKGAVLQISVSNGYFTTINIPKTSFYFSWNTFYANNIYIPAGYYSFKIYLQVDSGQNVSIGIANVQMY